MSKQAANHKDEGTPVPHHSPLSTQHNQEMHTQSVQGTARERRGGWCDGKKECLDHGTAAHGTQRCVHSSNHTAPHNHLTRAAPRPGYTSPESAISQPRNPHTQNIHIHNIHGESGETDGGWVSSCQLERWGGGWQSASAVETPHHPPYSLHQGPTNTRPPPPHAPRTFTVVAVADRACNISRHRGAVAVRAASKQPVAGRFGQHKTTPPPHTNKWELGGARHAACKATQSGNDQLERFQQADHGATNHNLPGRQRRTSPERGTAEANKKPDARPQPRRQQNNEKTRRRGGEKNKVRTNHKEPPQAGAAAVKYKKENACRPTVHRHILTGERSSATQGG